MKEMVTRACGHTEQVEVFGTAAQRENKLNWYKSTVCGTCYKAEQTKNCEAVEMKYGEYKNNYSSCKTGEYNKATKTIIVYIPCEAKEQEMPEEIAETTEITEDVVAEVKKEMIIKVTEMKKEPATLKANLENYKKELCERLKVTESELQELLKP